MSKILLLVIGLLAGFATTAIAAKMPKPGGGSYAEISSSGGGSSGYRHEMLMDLSFHYVRGTKAEDATGTAGRFSIGGMFTSWLGLDFQSLYEARAKNYLVGGDVRLTPNEWFFLKAGAGGYANKQTRALTFTPLAGAGIMARVTSDFYFVTETGYFQIDKRDNISFGAGLGASF